jgi:UDP-glucuronate 4-epimerase
VVDRDGVAALFEAQKPQRVIHLAAQAGVRYSITNPHAYIDSNVQGFTNVLEGCRHNGIEHLVYASSSSVYGGNTAMPFSEHHNVDHPVSLYAATKKANELMAHTYSHLFNLPTTGLRFFTVYGPWGRQDMAYFRLIEAAINGTNFTKFGGGEIKRDFTFVDDITSMIESLNRQLSETPKGHSDVVNIGGGKPYSLNDLIEIIITKSDSKLNMKVEESNPNDTKYTSANVEKLISLVGKKPEVDLNSGVSRTFAWASQPEVKQHLLDWIKSTI